MTPKSSRVSVREEALGKEETVGVGPTMWKRKIYPERRHISRQELRPAVLELWLLGIRSKVPEAGLWSSRFQVWKILPVKLVRKQQKMSIVHWPELTVWLSQTSKTA